MKITLLDVSDPPAWRRVLVPGAAEVTDLQLCSVIPYSLPGSAMSPGMRSRRAGNNRGAQQRPAPRADPAPGR